MISGEFDRENLAERKRRRERAAIKTAQKFNHRMLLFLEDLDKSDMSKTKRNEIRDIMLKHI